MQQPRPLGLRLAEPAGHADRADRQRGQALVGEAHRFQPAHFVRRIGQAVVRDHLLFVDDRFDLAQEPRVETGDPGDFLDGEILAEGLRDLEDAVGRPL